MNRYSASKLKTYESCRLQYKLHYLDKIEIPQPIAPETQFGSLIHEIAEEYNRSNEKEMVKKIKSFVLPDEYKKLLVETIRNLFAFQKSFCTEVDEVEKEYNFQDENIWLYGKADRIIRKEKSLICVDYKTSRSTNSKYHMFQMKFYNLLISKVEKIDPATVKIVIFYPRADVKDRFIFSRSEAQTFEDEICYKIKKIETNDNWYSASGKHCDWCSYKNKHCDKWK